MSVLFPSLKRLDVLATTPDCPLDANELLVYSVLMKKSHFKEAIKFSQIATATGLHVSTVSEVVKRLSDMDYRKPHPEHFRCTLEGPSFFRRCQYWQFYVPAKDSPVTVNMSLVWSYMMQKVVLEERPPEKGWTASYLATILRIDRRTVAGCLQELQGLDLLRYDGETYQFPRNLTVLQEGYFQKAGEKSVTQGGKSAVVDFFQPQTDLAPQKPGIYHCDLVRERLTLVHKVSSLSLEIAQSIESECQHLPDWRTNWPTYTDHLWQDHKKRVEQWTLQQKSEKQAQTP